MATTIPAACYLRMSTEKQQYSLDNQSDVIEQYALQHGFSIVQTYRDGSRSGLVLRNRTGLKHNVTLHLNGEDIQVMHLQAGHTDGDSAIFFPKSNVVHMGDDFLVIGFLSSTSAVAAAYAA